MMSPIEAESVIRNIVVKHINPDAAFIFLFGSRAMGKGCPASDYDVGIYQGEKIPFSVMARIQDDLEDWPIPVDVDIVDFALVSQEFKRLALKEIKLWNTPKRNLKLI